MTDDSAEILFQSQSSLRKSVTSNCGIGSSEMRTLTFSIQHFLRLENMSLKPISDPPAPRRLYFSWRHQQCGQRHLYGRPLRQVVKDLSAASVIVQKISRQSFQNILINNDYRYFTKAVDIKKTLKRGFRQTPEYISRDVLQQHFCLTCTFLFIFSNHITLRSRSGFVCRT